MNNIPDFVMQIEEVERNLKATWQVVNMNVSGDCVMDSFKEGVLDPYCEYFNKYITGESIYGLGVDDLMKKMDKFLQDMSELTGVSPDVAFSCAAGSQHNGGVVNIFDEQIPVEEMNYVRERGGVVHDERRDRDYWSRSRDGAKPGELQNEDIKDFFDNKN